MGKSPTGREAPGRVIYVAEIELDGSRSPEWVRAVFSIPGRESGLTFRWKLVDGTLDATCLDDLAAQVSSSITEAVVTMCGVQGVMR